MNIYVKVRFLGEISLASNSNVIVTLDSYTAFAIYNKTNNVRITYRGAFVLPLLLWKNNEFYIF